jgi:leucyl aminopeptidase
MKISFASLTLPETGALAVPVAKGRKLLASAAALDKATGGALKRAMAASRFKGDKKQILELLAPSGVGNSRIVLLGMGNPRDLETLDLEELGGRLLAHLNGAGETTAALALDDPAGGKSPRRSPASRRSSSWSRTRRPPKSIMVRWKRSPAACS